MCLLQILLKNMDQVNTFPPVVCEVEVSEIFVLSGTIITEGDGDEYANWDENGTDQMSNSNIGSWENIWNE